LYKISTTALHDAAENFIEISKFLLGHSVCIFCSSIYNEMTTTATTSTFTNLLNTR